MHEPETGTSWKGLPWRKKLSHVLRLTTIEPMMLIQGLAAFIGMYPQDQMLLYKICREDKFNLTVDFCSNIENHTDTGAYDAVEKEVVSFNNIISLAENLIPILFSFYIGSWSDRFGRKGRA